MLRLIRKALPQGDDQLSGTVEMDEAYMGGRFKSGKGNARQREAHAAKSVVLGAVERGGRVRAKVSSTGATAMSIWRFLDANVAWENTRLMTDSNTSYGNAARLYVRQSVNHSNKEFVRGNVYTNTMDAFWSHVKKSITGTHKVVSRKYLQAYLDGFAFHYNNRHSDSDRFASLLGALLLPAKQA